MAGPNSKPMVGAVAMAADLITAINNDGTFTVGADARVNASATMYYWTAFKAGPGKMVAGSYTGDGGASQAITGLGYQPELVYVISAGAGGNEMIQRSSAAPEAFNFYDGPGDATWIPTLGADGFTVGSDARVNTSPTVYHYVAWNEAAGYLDVGSYAGDASSPTRNITTVGFEPEYLFVRRAAQFYVAQQRPASLAQSSVDATLFFYNFATATNRITALLANGFQVSDQPNVNQAGGTFIYHAWKRQSQPRIVTGDYTGNAGATQQIVNVGFMPDVVIVKTSLQIAAIRTSTMAPNTSKSMTGTAAITAAANTQMIRSLDPDGFTVGSDIAVNDAFAYYFTAFKAAPGTMKVGTYLGDGNAAARQITGVGFSPELVFIMSAVGGAGNEAIHGSTAFTALGGQEHNFANSGGTASWISTFDADGFTLTSAAAQVNGNVGCPGACPVYHYIAWNEIPGQMDVGSYAGNTPIDPHNITGVGFEPEYVIVKENGAEPAVHHPASLGRTVDLTQYFSATVTAADLIQALQPDGFQVGTNADVNEAAGNNFVYYAWKRPFVTLTAVGLTALSATRYDRGVLAEWRTGHEIDNLGFHLYREVAGQRTRVTQSMVAGSGLTAGQGVTVNAEQRYAMWDLDGASADPSAVYWLEDVDFNGTRTLHGPVTPVQGPLDAPPNVTSSAALHTLGNGQARRPVRCSSREAPGRSDPSAPAPGPSRTERR